MTPLHVELRESREQKGLTLDALHATTRIGKDFLEAIERGDFDFLPRTYVRLFLRMYATQVGMDPQYVLDRYEEIKRPLGEEVRVETEPQRPVSWGTVMALTAGFILLGWAGVTMFKNRIGDRYPTASREALPTPSASVQEAPVQGTPESLRLAASDRTPQAVAKDSPAVSEQPAGQSDTTEVRPVSGVAWPERDSAAVLQGVCVEQTWLDVSADGQRVFRGEMQPGEERRWAARERFYVVSGRSSGIQFALQGRPLPRARTWASEVLRMSIARSGIEIEKRRRPVEGSEDTASSRRRSAADTVSSGQ